MPEPGRQYVIASDTAGGGSRGDAATAVVLDAETTDLVAAMSEKADPHVWGPRCARLGIFYNEGVLAFETEPSRHGLAAATEALRLEYPKLYYRRRRDSWRPGFTDLLGFSTDVGTKPLIISRIKKQIQERPDASCPWKPLLLELKAQHWDDNERMISKGHDDHVMAYGIGLMVRDDCYERGIIQVEARKPMPEHEKFWAREDRLAALRLAGRQKRSIPQWRR